MSITIKTNNVPRLLKYGYEMPDKFKSDFDYIGEDDFDFQAFFVYKGQWYDLGEFMRIPDNSNFTGWDGYTSDTYFSGILIKFVDEDSIIVGEYFS